MKRKFGYCIVILFVLCFVDFRLMAQTMTVERDTTATESLCTVGESDACVTITAPKSLQLTFESSMDAVVKIVSRRDVGFNTIYLLSFPTGYIYANRFLEIRAAQYQQPVEIHLNLSPKESRKYYIKIPECYPSLFSGAQELARKGFYTAASEKYKEAQRCSDAPFGNDIKARLKQLDTIIAAKRIADESFDLLDYAKAADNYKKIVSFNSEDETASRRYAESVLKRNQTCFKYLDKAEEFFKEKDFDKATELYLRALANGCEQVENGNLIRARIEYMRNYKEKKAEREWVISYQYASNTPIGVSFGGYKQYKPFLYASIRTNPDFFESLRSNYEKADKPEFNFSAGATFRLTQAIPLWMNAGVGYTGVGEYIYDPVDPAKEPDLKNYSALSPELGLLGKIGPIALSYTFQYRFAFDADKQSYIKPAKHIFGIGFCF